eukprot:6207640-Pleurochrysis_carterae.AAC.1
MRENFGYVSTHQSPLQPPEASLSHAATALCEQRVALPKQQSPLRLSPERGTFFPPPASFASVLPELLAVACRRAQDIAETASDASAFAVVSTCVRRDARR